MWYEEIKEIAEGLFKWDKSSKIIVLLNFQTAIAAIKKVEKTRKTRTGELRKVLRKVEEKR